MSKPEERATHPATHGEITYAFWAAAYAECIAKQFIKNGKLDPGDFIGMCHSIWELKGKIIGGCAIFERADELEMLYRGDPK